MKIPLSEIHIDEEFNCRDKIAPIDVVDLASDIEKHGLISPVVVSPTDKYPDKKYLLIAGHRRFVAHKVIQWTEIDAIIREGLGEREARLLNLKENLLRKNLNILEEARAIKRLFDLGITEADAAKELQTSRGWVQVRFMLLQLSKEIQQECAAGILSQTDIRELYSLRGEKEKQIEYVKAVKDARLKGQNVSKVRNKHTRKPSDKKLRKRPEIFDMMDHISESIGNGIWTRTMSWCAGEISDLELFHTIKIHAEEIGVPYSIPETGEDY